ncbi:MAG TPA: type II secretion system protein GspJ [Tepidisphaeraceae bacterium]|nr:type II secretion system protein GspJ [Tepidisphaeraceae bacterium]
MRTPRGFSLLELLLAMAMAAMLALSLYTAMNVALRARTSAHAAVAPTRTGMIAIDLVQRDFESVPPPTGTLGGTFYGGHQPAGMGDHDHVEFFTIGADPIEGDPADAPPLSEGIRRIELYVQTDGMDSPVLIRRVTRNLMPASEAPADEEILCRNVRSFSLRYYDGITWQEDWDSTMLDDTLPLAVAITIELGDADPAKPGSRVARVVPLACARVPADSGMMMLGGVQ